MKPPAELIEVVAAAMWECRDTADEPRMWDTAGDMWQTAYREMAVAAIDAVRRFD